MSDHTFTEAAFVDEVVRPWLYAEYGTPNVFEGVHLSVIDRYPDFVVDAGGGLVLMVEVEDDRESVIGGADQARVYAGASTLKVDIGPPDATHLPTVICPSGEGNVAELAILAHSDIHLVELDPTPALDSPHDDA